MREGLIWKDGELYYYKHDRRYHAGIVQDGDKLYYIGRGGRAVKGEHVVHGDMANGLVKHGTYTFGEDYALVDGSYIPPKKGAKRKKKPHKRKRVKAEFVKKSKPAKLKKKELIFVFASIGAVLALSVALGVMFMPDTTVTPPSSSQAPSAAVERIVLPADRENVVLCNELTAAWQKGEETLEKAVKQGDPYRPFTVEYVSHGEKGVFYIAEKADLSDAATYDMPPDKEQLVIHNLKTGTTYYYRAVIGNDVTDGSFKTAPGTRFIYLPDVRNVRDIGGYKTTDGHTVKQGMIIRGTEADGLIEPSYLIKSDGKALADQLGFVYEMDLREKETYIGTYISRLGADVRHRFYTAPNYGHIFTEFYKDSLKNIFSDLADPNNYPMYMHCTYGADRTGTIVYLLQGLLGVSDQDMKTEYTLTAFAFSSYADADALQVVDEGLQSYAGDTMQEKIETFLIEDIGVTPEEIGAIKEILLEETDG